LLFSQHSEVSIAHFCLMFSGCKTFNILVALSSTSPALQHWSLVNDFGLAGISLCLIWRLLALHWLIDRDWRLWQTSSTFQGHRMPAPWAQIKDRY